MDENREMREEMMGRLAKLRPLSGIAATREPGERAPLPGLASELVAELAPFERAGWRFVVPTPEAAAESQRTLFRDGDGHVKIDGRALNLRFHPEADRPEIESFLADRGLVIRRELGFAPNLFLIVPGTRAKREDTLSLARSLTGEPIVIYAEPVLIEELTHR